VVKRPPEEHFDTVLAEIKKMLGFPDSSFGKIRSALLERVVNEEFDIDQFKRMIALAGEALQQPQND
jgi:hypothetical protein